MKPLFYSIYFMYGFPANLQGNFYNNFSPVGNIILASVFLKIGLLTS